jgi:hypothetical protein
MEIDFICLIFPICSSKSFTFPQENRKNIETLALSPNGVLLLAIDEGTLIFGLHNGSQSFTDNATVDVSIITSCLKIS